MLIHDDMKHLITKNKLFKTKQNKKRKRKQNFFPKKKLDRNNK